jgi:uncharacterized protein (AIM24 family)
LKFFATRVQLLPVFSLLLTFFRWLLRRAAAAVLIAGLSLLAYATWLYLQDRTDFDVVRIEQIARLAEERDKASAEVALGDSKLTELRAKLAGEQHRAARAGNVITNLKGLDSTWERLFGDREQQRKNRQGAERMAALQKQAQDHVLALQGEITRAGWEREAAAARSQQINEKLTEVENTRSPVIHYLNTAWEQLKWYLVGFVALWVVGRIVWRFAVYFLIAPFVARGKPVALADSLESLPAQSAAGAQIEVALWPGEMLTVRGDYLPSPLVAEAKRKRVFRWWMPLTSYLSGLVNLSQLTNAFARGDRSITLVAPAGTKADLGLVQLPEGGSIVLRPRFLVGTISAADQPTQVRTHWHVFSRQAWASLQLRFLEVQGPCRLIVAAPRGLESVHLQPRTSEERLVSRKEREAWIGFTPTLKYGLARSDGFIAYLQGRRPLFEAQFSGAGIILSAHGHLKRRRGFTARVFGGARSGLMNLFGV